jgi:hypothetical protein
MDAVRNARGLSKWRRAATLITYGMVRTLRDGRPSEVDFKRLNTDFAGFTTAVEVLGSLDAMIEEIQPRVDFQRGLVKDMEQQRSALDFEEPEPEPRQPKAKKRSVIRLTPGGKGYERVE